MSLCCVALALPLLVGLPLAGAQTRPVTILSPEQMVQQGANLSRGAAQELEAQLEKNPEDLTARAKLLGYYWYQWMQPGEAAAKAARRRHILWLIEHHPESPVTGLEEAAISEAGNALIDPEGYSQARKLWLSQIEAKKGNPYLLGNVAKFFQMSDKPLAESALLQAKAMQPENGEWDWRLGYLYAMGILGVDALGVNGQPTSADPFAASGPFAAKAKKALAESTSGTMLAVAASMLWRYGTMLAPTERGKLDYVDDAIKLVQQAKSAEPTNPSWPQFLAQLQAFKVQVQSPAPKPK
jgi:hypothetical protein